MKSKLLISFGLIVLLLPVVAMAVPKTVDWHVLDTVELPTVPQDLAVGADGRLYLLAADGKVKIVAADGRDLGRIDAGLDADRIYLGAKGERLYVCDSKGRKMKVVALTDVVAIPVDGSPFLGAAEAAITVVVFSDFQ